MIMENDIKEFGVEGESGRSGHMQSLCTLYEKLMMVRNDYASERDVRPFQVMTDDALYMIVITKPCSSWQFKELKGIGNRYADDLASLMIPIIREFIGEDEIERRNNEEFMLEMEGIMKPVRSRPEEEIPEEDRDLYELLRKIRLDLARDAGWPAYCIMSNKALREVVSLKPATIEEFGRIPGISARRRDESGGLFVSAILEYLTA